MAKKIVIANWKMNPASAKEALDIFNAIKKFGGKYSASIVVCPPFPFLSLFSFKAKNLFLGAQNLFYEKKGAFTGEVASPMLASLNVSYSLVGHSERRKLGETDDVVSRKISSALSEKITPIVCVGEKERDGEGIFFNYLKEQVLSSLKSISKKQISKIIVAYEPVWAISTEGNGAMDSSAIYETIIFLRKILVDKYGKEASKVKIIYGGSVNSKNINSIFSSGVDGVLVGKDSLSPVNFEKIVKEMSA